MAFEIEVDREHIENTLSVTYTMGQINSYMEIIRELKEIPEDNVVDIRKTIGRLQDRIQMLLALNPEAKLELETERSEGLKLSTKISETHIKRKGTYYVRISSIGSDIGSRIESYCGW